MSHLIWKYIAPTIIAELAGYVIGHIKIGAKRLVVYIQSHIQRVHGKLLKNLNEIDMSQGLD